MMILSLVSIAFLFLVSAVAVVMLIRDWRKARKDRLKDFV